MTCLRVASALAALALGCGEPAAAPPEPQGPPASEVVAWLDGQPIKRDDVGPPVAFRVWRHEVDIYSLLKAETEKLVDERLLAAEASRRGTSVEAVLAEVSAGAAPVAEAEIERYLEEHPRESAAAATAARPRIRHFLEERRRIERRLAFMGGLREAAGYRFVLARPQQPRTRIDVTGAPARGEDSAPVTIVHFASFSSRESARSAERIARLRAELPGSVRQVHRSFLSERDEVGLLAAQLAEIAQEEGVFWELHDALFARAGRLDAAGVADAAREAGLSDAALERAASDVSLLERVRSEIALGISVGAPREPTLFVNGRYASGVLPYDELLALVREELPGS